MDTNERICIIGAGPSGIAAAMYLQVKGYTNVEIFEKAPRVGGKTAGLWEPAGADSYYAVRELERFGGTDHALVFSEDRVYLGADGTPEGPFGTSKGRPFAALKLTNQLRKLARLLETKYKGCACYGHVGLSKGGFFGLSKEMDNHLRRVRGKNRNLRELALPFDQFCRINGVEEAAKLWLAPLSASGCGYPDELPAAYVLKRFGLETVLAFHDESYWEWEDGARKIFEAVNRRLIRPAKLCTEVVSVARDGEGIRVTVQSEAGEREERFDKLIVTAPLPDFAAYADVSEEERSLFDRIRRKKAAQLLIRVPANAMPPGMGFVPGNFTPEKSGHLVVWQRKGEPAGEERLVAATAYLNHEGSLDVPAEEAFANLEAELGLFGFAPEERLAVRESFGMPFVPCADYADGWYDRLEALQGQRGTYYGGEILSAGSLEDACAVSRDLVGRFF